MAAQHLITAMTLLMISYTLAFTAPETVSFSSSKFPQISFSRRRRKCSVGDVWMQIGAGGSAGECMRKNEVHFAYSFPACEILMTFCPRNTADFCFLLAQPPHLYPSGRPADISIVYELEAYMSLLSFEHLRLLSSGRGSTEVHGHWIYPCFCCTFFYFPRTMQCIDAFIHCFWIRPYYPMSFCPYVFMYASTPVYEHFWISGTRNQYW